jgi:hypothetical protein
LSARAAVAPIHIKNPKRLKLGSPFSQVMRKTNEIESVNDFSISKGKIENSHIKELSKPIKRFLKNLFQ